MLSVGSFPPAPFLYQSFRICWQKYIIRILSYSSQCGPKEAIEFPLSQFWLIEKFRKETFFKKTHCMFLLPILWTE